MLLMNMGLPPIFYSDRDRDCDISLTEHPDPLIV
jgi:hypothetical protein